MKFRLLFYISLVALLAGCDSRDPDKIIERAIAYHGGNTYDRIFIEFDFRNRHYSSQRDGGLYTYTRSFSDTTGTYQDELSNDGFRRLRNGSEVNLNDEWASRYSNSVNSVIYFALLPYGLQDAAVNKKYVREEVIRGNAYHIIEVTFDEEGGGEDFEDVFYYWINTANGKVDYLAYTYETEEEGVRFREAINHRRVGGILFQDYINFKPASIVPLDSLTNLYNRGELKELSRIKLENISVNPL